MVPRVGVGANGVFAQDLLYLGLLPEAIQIIKTKSVLKLLARTQIVKIGFEVEIKLQKNGKYHTNKPTASM